MATDSTVSPLRRRMIEDMAARGLVGEKAGQGFYRREPGPPGAGGSETKVSN